MNIVELQDKYIGKHIPINTSTKEIKLGRLGTREVETYTLTSEGEAIVEEFQRDLDSKFHARIWLPNTIGTMDYRLDRVNLKIGKDGIVTKITIG
jgi:hypothetical protein